MSKTVLFAFITAYSFASCAHAPLPPASPCLTTHPPQIHKLLVLEDPKFVDVPDPKNPEQMLNITGLIVTTQSFKQFLGDVSDLNAWAKEADSKCGAATAPASE